MNYNKLNEKHKTHINGSIIPIGQADFKWEDDELDEIVLGCFSSQPDRSYYSDEAKSILQKINKIIYDYNNRKITIDEFNKIIIGLIEKNESIKTYISSNHYKTLINKQKSSVIVGPGGMGKTHYVKYAEEKLSSKNINHLCIYCKYLSSFKDIDWDELQLVSNEQEFVLIIDAFNELSQNIQSVFLDNIQKLANTRFARVFITYRTNTLNKSIESRLKSLMKNTHEFLGVSYEDTIDLLVENYGVDIFKFEDIAYSNNALCLKMLVKTIDKTEHIDKLGYIKSIYYLIEQYIKKSINKQTWEYTKILAEYLYQNNAIYFTIHQLPSSIKNPSEFINKMAEYGFIVHSYDDKYTFSNETILNYLRSRFFIKELKKNDIEQNISVINNWRDEWGMHDVILASVFERYVDNIDTAFELVKNTFLNDSFNLLSLRGIKFSNNSIELLKNRISLNYPVYECFFDFAGYEYSPFNCINYCSDFFTKNPEEIVFMCKNKTDYHLVGQLRYRLRNMLNLIKHISFKNNRSDEYLFTAIWASSLTDRDIHIISSKIIFELAQKFPTYISMLCEFYVNSRDDDIKENIAFSLSYQSKTHSKELNPFFEAILEDEEEINSHILAYASQYLNKNLGYIDLPKRDISKEYLNLPYNKEIFHYADTADMYQQYWIGFRTNYNTSGIRIIDRFMKTDKYKVNRWNNAIDKQFHCMIKGQCSGYTYVEEEIIKRNPPSFDINNTFSDDELYSMFQGVFEETAKQYQFDDKKDTKYDYPHYFNSYIAKILLISSKRFFGSLMSNYYMDSFMNYEYRRDMVGYRVYDPFEYDDDSPSIISPISKYNSDIDVAEKHLLKRIKYDGIKDKQWANDVELSRRNMLSLINEELLIRRQIWIPIVIIANNAEHTNDVYSEMINSDEYNIFASFNEEYELDDTGRNRKCTIELPTAKCNISDYPFIKEFSVCHQIDSFVFNQNSTRVSRLIMPPPILIKELELHFDAEKSVWVNDNNEEVILCDNNKSDKYHRAISTIVLIRKTEFEKACKSLYLKYFAFTERYINIPGVGYGNECENHYQIENGKIKICIKNTGADHHDNKCDSCPHNMLDINNYDSLDPFKYEEVLKELGLDKYSL